jgi:NAD(P)H-flavin reductase
VRQIEDTAFKWSYSIQIAPRSISLSNASSTTLQWRRLKIIYTITRLEKAKTWAGKTGRIDADLIQEHAGALDTPLYYVCGSLTMVNDIGRLLKDALNIAAEDMRTEKFTGY